jgi:hypothetical protein
MTEPKTWAQVKTSFSAPIERVQLCSRPDLADRIDELKKEYQTARVTDEMLNEPDRAPGIAEEIERLREEALAATVTFVLQGVPHHVEEALQEAHPPSDAQKRIAQEQKFYLPFNPDTHYPAMLAACCIEPTGMTPADWIELYGQLTDGQLARFRNALTVVCHGVTDVPKGVTGFEKTGDTATN